MNYLKQLCVLLGCCVLMACSTNQQQNPATTAVQKHPAPSLPSVIHSVAEVLPISVDSVSLFFESLDSMTSRKQHDPFRNEVGYSRYTIFYTLDSTKQKVVSLSVEFQEAPVSIEDIVQKFGDELMSSRLNKLDFPREDGFQMQEFFFKNSKSEINLVMTIRFQNVAKVDLEVIEDLKKM